MGFEPTTSTLTMWRALQAAPQGADRIRFQSSGPRGIQDPQSLLLRQVALPVAAYRAMFGPCSREGGSRGTRTHKRAFKYPPPVFETGPSSGRMTSVSLRSPGVPGAGIEPAVSAVTERGVTTSRNCPGMCELTYRRFSHSFRFGEGGEEESNLQSTGSRAGEPTPLADPRARPCGELNPPVRFGRPVPRPLGQGRKDPKARKERESNSLKAIARPAFKAAAITSWLALPAVWKLQGRESNPQSPG